MEPGKREFGFPPSHAIFPRSTNTFTDGGGSGAWPLFIISRYSRASRRARSVVRITSPRKRPCGVGPTSICSPWRATEQRYGVSALLLPVCSMIRNSCRFAAAALLLHTSFAASAAQAADHCSEIYAAIFTASGHHSSTIIVQPMAAVVVCRSMQKSTALSWPFGPSIAAMAFARSGSYPERDRSPRVCAVNIRFKSISTKRQLFRCARGFVSNVEISSDG
mmetsp:Transcript_7894/g.17423  ORF Transcript_7894/g.17423 Transcript_7894/m.17423 type:complete len:221 (-) Transcript_7894:205-867(-)